MLRRLMSPGRFRRVVCLALLQGAAPATYAGGSIGCTPQCNAVPACEDGVSLQSSLAVAPDALSGAQIEFCRNAICATGAADTVSSGAPEVQSELTAASFSVEFSAALRADGSTLVTFGYLSDGTAGGDTSYTNGDVYRASIVSAAGAPVLAGSVVAHYYGSQETCGQTCVQFAGTL